MATMKQGACYWRFKTDKAWRYGYASEIKIDLWRMGSYSGDYTFGVLVDPKDIDRKDYY